MSTAVEIILFFLLLPVGIYGLGRLMDLTAPGGRRYKGD